MPSCRAELLISLANNKFVSKATMRTLQVMSKKFRIPESKLTQLLHTHRLGGFMISTFSFRLIS